MFLEKLDYQMHCHGLTKPELAKAIHIPYTTLITWYTTEKEVDNIRAGVLKQLSEYFNVSLEYWFEEGLEYRKPKSPKKTIEYDKQEALQEMLRNLNTLNNEIQRTLNQNEDTKKEE